MDEVFKTEAPYMSACRVIASFRFELKITEIWTLADQAIVSKPLTRVLRSFLNDDIFSQNLLHVFVFRNMSPFQSCSFPYNHGSLLGVDQKF